MSLKEHIQQENEELKERIRAGAKEYTKLFDKYRLIKNQQFNSDMNVYHDLSSGDIHLGNRLPATRQRSSTSSTLSDSAIRVGELVMHFEKKTNLLDAIILGHVFLKFKYLANLRFDANQNHKNNS